MQLSPSKPIYAGSRYIIRYSPVRMLIADPMPPKRRHPRASRTISLRQFFAKNGMPRRDEIRVRIHHNFFTTFFSASRSRNCTVFGHKMRGCCKWRSRRTQGGIPSNVPGSSPQLLDARARGVKAEGNAGSPRPRGQPHHAGDLHADGGRNRDGARQRHRQPASAARRAVGVNQKAVTHRLTILNKRLAEGEPAVTAALHSSSSSHHVATIGRNGSAPTSGSLQESKPHSHKRAMACSDARDCSCPTGP